MIQTEIIERKSKSWGEDSPHMDKRLIDEWVLNHQGSRIISCMHSGVKHLLIIYDKGPEKPHKHGYDKYGHLRVLDEDGNFS